MDHATDTPDAPAILGAANALAAAPVPGQWLKLADYGDWPHPSGLQRFTRPAAEAMARGFQTLWNRLRRRFGGVPVFVGHPDDAAFAGQPGHDDTRAYAWITSLEARDDGLYVMPRWSEPGRELLRQAFYKFLSPRWQMRPIATGVFEPVRLLSVGLTNHPNIPGEAIANQQGSAAKNLPPRTLLPRLLEIFELDVAAAPDVLVANAEQLAQAARDTRAAQIESARFYRLATDADAARVAAERRADDERSARVEVMLDLAEIRGRVPPAARADWRDRLLADFDRAGRELAETQTATANVTLPPALRSLGEGGSCLPPAGSPPVTGRLAARRQNAVGPADSGRFLTLVNERMVRTGENYATAFARAKREHAALFPR